jgi:NRPS condensation-like uncharacterized protein
MRLPANTQDWFNYVARRGISNHLIQAVLRFQSRLDHPRLEQAFKLAVEAEPILGCRFVEDGDRPYWQSIDGFESAERCPLQLCDQSEQILADYLRAPIASEAQIEARLLRSRDCDTLCIKLDHACCDGGGAKHFLSLLTRAFNTPAAFRVPRPQPDRSLEPLWKALIALEPTLALKAEEAVFEATWGFPRQATQEPSKPALAIRQISPATLSGLHDLAKRNGASLTDVLLSAFYRAAAVIEPSARELNLTVDLRRHLADEGPICNRSAIIEIKPVAGKSLSDAVKLNARIKRKLLDAGADILSARGCQQLDDMGYRRFASLDARDWQQAQETGHCSPMLSNLGALDLEAFGGIRADEAFLVGPFFHAPAVLLAASTYRDRLTLSLGYYAPEVSPAVFERLLDLLCAELETAEARRPKER